MQLITLSEAAEAKRITTNILHTWKRRDAKFPPVIKECGRTKTGYYSRDVLLAYIDKYKNDLPDGCVDVYEASAITGLHISTINRFRVNRKDFQPCVAKPKGKGTRCFYILAELEKWLESYVHGEKYETIGEPTAEEAEVRIDNKLARFFITMPLPNPAMICARRSGYRIGA